MVRQIASQSTLESLRREAKRWLKALRDKVAGARARRWMLNIAVRENDLSLAEWILSHGATADPRPATDNRSSKQSVREDALRGGRFDSWGRLVERFTHR